MESTIELRALGKLWGELREGRYLDVRRHDDRVATIDLVESARQGRTVVVRILHSGDCKRSTDVLD